MDKMDLNLIRKNIVPNPKIQDIESKIDELGNIELFNELNTPFEKLGIDRIICSINNKKTFENLNENINLFLEKFKEFEITLTKEDFIYTPQTEEYMRYFFEKNLQKQKEFYNTHDEISLHIELNIRHLYYNNSSKIEKNLNERNEKKLSLMNLDKNGLVKRYFDLYKELIKTRCEDPNFVIDNILKNRWKQAFDENKIKSLYEKYYIKNYYDLSKEEQEEVDIVFAKLLYTLKEFKTYKKYKYILDILRENSKKSYDIKNKVLKKSEKEVIKQTKKFRKLSVRSKFPFLLFISRKVNDNDKFINSKIKEIEEIYLEYDENCVNEKISKFLKEDCSIKYMLKVAISYYLYSYNLIKKYKNDVDPELELQNLIEFINQPFKTMLNNVKLSEESNISNIVIDRYKLLNVQLEDNLEDNLDSIISDIEKIVNHYYIRKSNILERYR